MSYFEINGPDKLKGEIEVGGAKNAAMKMIAASVLIPAKVTLENVPDILDIQTIINILKNSGAEITRSDHTLTIDTTNLENKNPEPKLVKKMRGSIVLLGPYLARFGQIAIPQPGGCSIGARPIDIHLDVFTQMGVEVLEKKDEYCNFQLKTNGRIKASKIKLSGVSVTATENAIMAAATASGVTTISNAACEPEIADLAEFLNKAGAKISGAGTKTIQIEGVEKLRSLTHRVMPDRIEAGTFVALGVITKSPIKITECRPEHLTAFTDKIKEMGVDLEIGPDFIQINDVPRLKPVSVETEVYPGLATDLQAPIGLILTQAEGTSHLKENIFENRLGYLNQLKEMGAKIEILSATEAEITGPAELAGKKIESLDLRAGATMILAGLAATGTTTILDAEIIDRGYEKIEKRLSDLGARIKRVG